MEPIDYFDNLIHSIATARLLLQKAHKDGALIEGLCLYVSVIDGFLRLSIVYSRTQKSPEHTYEFEKNLIHQSDDEKTYSEKEIYKIVYEEGIISDELHKKLLKMYEFRNKVIHRFSISIITYEQIAEACIEFEKIYQEIYSIVDLLENGPGGPKKVNLDEQRNIWKRMMRKVTG